MRSVLLVLLVLIPGIAAVTVCACVLPGDWLALQSAHANAAGLAAANAELRELFIAVSAEQRHRLNCFAEGVGMLLGAILVGIAVHGLFTPREA